MNKYSCSECGGKGFYEVRSPEGHFTEGCVKCGGSGKTQIKISLEEYDLLKKRIEGLELSLGIC